MLSNSGLYVDVQLCSVLLLFVQSVSSDRFQILQSYTLILMSPTHMCSCLHTCTYTVLQSQMCVCVGPPHRSQHYQFSSETSCIMLHHQRQDIDSVKSENTQFGS